MKNKKWLLPVLIVLGIIAFLAVSFFIFAGFMSARGYGISVGRALYTKDGSVMLVVDENSPIRMSDRSNKTEKGELFEGLTSGDKILVVHTAGIEESYPAHMGAYLVIKLSDGNFGDIPDKVIETLTSMGWLSHIYSGEYSFSLTFGIGGESFYDTESGKLVKTTLSSNPSKFVTEYYMSEQDFDTVLNMIWAMDISSYPTEYDPINPPDAKEKLMSEPHDKLVLTYRAGDYEKKIICEEVALGAGGYDERARAFLELCDYIECVVVNSDEWKALPPYEVMHE